MVRVNRTGERCNAAGWLDTKRLSSPAVMLSPALPANVNGPGLQLRLKFGFTARTHAFIVIAHKKQVWLILLLHHPHENIELEYSAVNDFFLENSMLIIFSPWPQINRIVTRIVIQHIMILNSPMRSGPTNTTEEHCIHIDREDIIAQHRKCTVWWQRCSIIYILITVESVKKIILRFTSCNESHDPLSHSFLETTNSQQY
jgi:hypothetical protein